MSAAPSGTTAAEYDGSGDWFKVFEMGPASITSEGLQWGSNGLQNFTFTLPEEVPAGQYLLRAESIALHGASVVGGAQFYISCAQIEVTSSSTETPTPVVDIPGLYTGEEPGILINIYYPIPTNYTMPGPAVWPADGSSSSNGTTTTSSNSTATVAATSAAATTSSAAVSSSATAVTTQVVAVTTSASYSVSANSTIASTGFLTSTRSLLTLSASSAASTGASSGVVAKKYAQCGGKAWTGATECESGSACTSQNDYYSQCV